MRNEADRPRWKRLLEREPRHRLLYAVGAPAGMSIDCAGIAGEHGGGAGTADDGGLVIVWPGSAPEEVFLEIVERLGERAAVVGMASIELGGRLDPIELFDAALRWARVGATKRAPGVFSQAGAIDEALREGWITTVFQPIVRSCDGRVIGYEALVRGREGELRSAPDLLNAALAADRMADLSARIRRRAVEGIEGAGPDDLLFLNLHPLDLFDPGFVEGDALQGPLARISRRVVLEVSERTAIDSLDDVREVVGGLRALGFRVAVDDLGSGYAGLTSLVALEPEFIKLDMSLVRPVVHSAHTRSLLRAIIEFARRVGTQVIAEGVEREEEARALVDLGCDHLQGFWIARPAMECVVPGVSLAGRGG